MERVIELSDGTPANYIQIDWRYHTFDLMTVAVVAYKNGNMICVLGHGLADIPAEYLNNMVTSLSFNLPKKSFKNQ